MLPSTQVHTSTHRKTGKNTCNLWWSKAQNSFANALFKHLLYLENMVRSLFRPPGVNVFKNRMEHPGPKRNAAHHLVNHGSTGSVDVQWCGVCVALKVFEAHQQSFILRDVQGCVRQATTGCPPHLAVYLEACSCARSLASVFLHPRPRLPHVAVSAEEDASVSGGFLWFASSLLLLLLLSSQTDVLRNSVRSLLFAVLF